MYSRISKPAIARQGFTLIELVLSISVGVIISGIAATLLWNASRQRAEVSTRGELFDAASAAVEVVFRYVREIPQDECPSNPTPCLLAHAQISTASATDLRFGNTGFRLNAGNNTVEMTIDNGAHWYALVKEASGFAISYRDRSGSALTSFPLSSTDRAAVRRVGIDLTLTRGGETAHVRSGLYLRSFMNEVTLAP